eukprot:CAMPEP_0172389800 /NCGR_PEP_ID=MMETSP1061-20121228/6591_1 /TAXON_ID=37318 /ORGANISM="Pseudo-nitzschia pungens, Strain cf. pungens" /LENGTH=106 /DNA_ID=CAMNT_0013120027 /DNA_START=52 /DNA_END=375 /DNA_ORIENTATION=-
MFKSVIALALVASAAAFAPMVPAGRGQTALFGEQADRVREIIAENCECDLEKVVDEASFVGDLGLDSLDTVELIMAIEEEFDCEIPEEEAAKISTVGEVVTFIEGL